MQQPKAKRQLFAPGNENDPFASNRPAKVEHVSKAEINHVTPPQLSVFMDVKTWGCGSSSSASSLSSFGTYF
jgi:hypothetical protein